MGCAGERKVLLVGERLARQAGALDSKIHVKAAARPSDVPNPLPASIKLIVIEQDQAIDFIQNLPRRIAWILTAEAFEPAVLRQAMSLHCCDFVRQDSPPSELSWRILHALAQEEARDSLEKECAALRELSEHDPLTHLYNRRGFHTHGCRTLAKANRLGKAVAVWQLDVDHFKRINDEHGHALGDKLLRNLANLLRARLRSYDLIARVGGDEFAILLIHVNPEQCKLIARDLLCAAQRQQIAGNSPITYSLSIGIATTPQLPAGRHAFGSLLNLLLDIADKELYCAKKRGRNQVSITELTPQELARAGADS